MKYYSISEIMRRDSLYYFIFGKRSNGKTYSALQYGLNRYLDKGERTAYVRRWDTDIKAARAKRIAKEVSEILHNDKNKKYSGCEYYQGAFYLTKDKKIKHKDGSVEHTDVKEKEPFMFAIALNNMEHEKGGNINADDSNITTIIFDEMITRMRYLPDEVSMFFDTVSTIRRNRNDVKVIMLANTVSKYCPYFKALNIEFAPSMEIGQIRANKKGTVVVERTEDNAEGTDDPYYDFDNKTVGMITHGKWEVAEYPKITTTWTRKEVMQDVFLYFDGKWLHGEIVNKNANPFIFWYPKYDDIKNPDSDTIFSDVPDYRRNWHDSFLRATDPQGKLIAYLFSQGKVFYSDNDTGEILRNYIIQNTVSTQAKYRNI